MVARLLILLMLLSCSMTLTAQIKDGDGNVYSYVIMGTQVWLAENLKTTKFNDGESIPLVSDANKWKSMQTPAYCWLNNDIGNKDIYGGLYNWYTVRRGKLCPKGWHVPSAGEWDVLVAFVGGDETAGFRLKEKGDDHWKNSLSTPYDEFGFRALPGGLRMSPGNFPVFANGYCVWWTSTGDISKNLAWNRGLFFSSNRIYKGNESMRSGFSVRCLRDQ